MTKATLQPRIAAETADSYTVMAGRADGGLVILCDHASNAFPPGYGTLGLPAGELQRHIAYDIGAAAITRHLAAAFDAPAVLTHYSRLLIDPNRGIDDPTLIMRLSDGAIIPGNRVLDAQERETRIRRYHRPYHQAIDRVLDQCLEAGVPPVILSMHSMTDCWKGVHRPWQIAVLWDRDPRLPELLIAAFRADPALTVGDNEPYHGRLEGDCMWTHASSRGLAHAIIEVRQDLIGTAAGQSQWAERIGSVLRDLLRKPDVRRRLNTLESFP
jgi:predicted N-formylglutamate amidohydrolase